MTLRHFIPNSLGFYDKPIVDRHVCNNEKIRYSLRCMRCGWESYEDKYLQYCPTCGPDSFLRTVYAEPTVDVAGDPSYFYSYQNFLPFKSKFGKYGPMIGCIKVKKLGEEIGLNNLWLLLSCYAPEYGAKFMTATFKEVEALGVLARVQDQTKKVLIVSSAGNAARAFLEIGSKYRVPTIVVVPESALPTLCVSELPGDRSPVLISLRNAFYPDAIRFVEEVQNVFCDRLVREGGCYNVARRDSVGILVHRAVKAIGRIPDHYVQAVGSGTGAIAAWEATRRLAALGKFGNRIMKLHLVQNAPFTPMVNAWRKKNRHIETIGKKDLRKILSQTYAKILSNDTPPYSVTGGIYDALSSTRGNMYSVSNREGMEASKLLLKYTGISPCPEASVALAGLQQAIREGEVNSKDCVLVHITGGGWERLVRDFKKQPYPVAKSINLKDSYKVMEFIEKYLESIFGKKKNRKNNI